MQEETTLRELSMIKRYVQGVLEDPMRVRIRAWIIGFLLSSVVMPAIARPQHAKHPLSASLKQTQRSKQAVVRDLAAYLNWFFQRRDHLFNSLERKNGRYKLETLDIQSDWALAYIAPRIDSPAKVDALMPDGLSFLLKNRHGKWHVLCMGTSLDDTARFHVPQRLKDKWDIE